MILDRQVAIVTGGTRGIGAACAKWLADNGATVVCLDVDPDSFADLDAAKASWDEASAGRVSALQCDITDAEQVQRTVEAIAAANDRIDILVNNAGITGRNSNTWEMRVEDWHKMYDVLIHGAFYMMKATIPFMLENSYGRIVNVSSVAGKEGNPNSASYSSAKAALLGLTKTAGKELATSGVLVNAITPGVIETRMNGLVDPDHHNYLVGKIPMGRVGRPEEVAEMVGFLSSPRVSFSTAAVFDLSGGRTTY